MRQLWGCGCAVKGLRWRGVLVPPSNTESCRLCSVSSDSRAGEGAPRTVDHAVIGGVVAVVVFAMLCLLIVLGRYFARHKGRLNV